jgi:sulfur-oxidizing protein SoxZ
MTNPTRIRAVARDGVTEVRMLMSHVMETGRRKDPAGNPVAAHFITGVDVRHNDRLVLAAEFGPSASANPYLLFRFSGAVKGERISVSWIDNRGETRSDEVQIA